MTTLFSMLVFRAILFNSTYSLGGGNLIFRSLQEFLDACQDQDENHMCNRQAYSRQTITNRTTTNAPRMWTAADGLLKWFNKFTQKGTKPTFKECKKQLITLKITSAGDLVQLLILGDLFLGDYIQAPDDREFATTILRMKLGAQRCMSLLQLIVVDGKNVATELNIASFLYLYERTRVHAIESGISPPSSMCNLFQFEHLLCKVLRACKNKSSGIADLFTENDVVLPTVNN